MGALEVTQGGRQAEKRVGKQAGLREKTGRGMTQEVGTAVSGRLRKNDNKYHCLCPEVKQPRP